MTIINKKTMKKIFSMLFVAAALCIVVASCGDEKDEPDVPKTQLLESEHGVANDTYLVWNIDLNQDSSSINVYNAVFQMGDKQSPALNISIKSPCTVDKTGKIYSLIGTNIIPNLILGFYGDIGRQHMIIPVSLEFLSKDTEGHKQRIKASL